MSSLQRNTKCSLQQRLLVDIPCRSRARVHDHGINIRRRRRGLIVVRRYMTDVPKEIGATLRLLQDTFNVLVWLKRGVILEKAVLL